MSEDWKKLQMDCCWKRLLAVVVRAVPAGPQPLSLRILSVSGETLSVLTEEFTANPTWRLPLYPKAAFPLQLQLSTESRLLWSGAVDLTQLFFVTSSLSALERCSELLVLLSFGEYGYYTTESFARLACAAAQSNSDQQKSIAVNWAQATEMDFGRLQEKYAQ